MTTHVIVAIKDTAVNAFSPPASFPTAAFAIRTFAEQTNQPGENNNIYKHPADFELWQLATWDERTGMYADNQPTMIARAIDHKEKQQ